MSGDDSSSGGDRASDAGEAGESYEDCCLRLESAAYADLDLDKVLDTFVAQHAGRHRQRTPGWVRDKASSIGGSEIAALMGLNPYSSFDKVVAAKMGLNPFTGNIACRWGTLLESAIERFVEIDCGTRLAGTDISVPSPAGSGLQGRHANSPDGYGVVAMFLDADEEDPAGFWRLLTTDAETQARAKGRPTKRVIALVEFKCPYSRQPKGVTPTQYEPQIWSGLALSPIAHLGLFIDAAFRRCALWSLGPAPGYDTSYHRERRVARWGPPIAWGLTGIFAPRLDARDSASAGAADVKDEDIEVDLSFAEGGIAVNAAYEAWLLHYKAFGKPFESPKEAARAGRAFGPAPIDFGAGEKEIFDTMMLHLDKGRFQAEHVGPCFPDGRGAALGTKEEIRSAVAALGARPPPGHYLLGVMPWKMLEVDYAFVERRPGFLAEISPLVHSCLDLAAELGAAPDPAAAYYARLEGSRMKSWAAGEKAAGAPSVSAAQVQDLFDAL